MSQAFHLSNINPDASGWYERELIHTVARKNVICKNIRAIENVDHAELECDIDLIEGEQVLV